MICTAVIYLALVFGDNLNTFSIRLCKCADILRQFSKRDAPYIFRDNMSKHVIYIY